MFPFFSHLGRQVRILGTHLDARRDVGEIYRGQDREKIWKFGNCLAAAIEIPSLRDSFTGFALQDRWVTPRQAKRFDQLSDEGWSALGNAVTRTPDIQGKDYIIANTKSIRRILNNPRYNGYLRRLKSGDIRLDWLDRQAGRKTAAIGGGIMTVLGAAALPFALSSRTP